MPSTRPRRPFIYIQYNILYVIRAIWIKITIHFSGTRLSPSNEYKITRRIVVLSQNPRSADNLRKYKKKPVFNILADGDTLK